ncbi:MAG: hypothetical protein NC428_00790 [Clostridium sp.]|nr:hypothetical protein [Clostridium sp.]
MGYKYAFIKMHNDSELMAGSDSAKQKFSKPLEYYITEIEKMISYLDIIDMKDDYANELRLRYKGITEPQDMY